MYIVYIHIRCGTQPAKEDVYNTRCILKFNDNGEKKVLFWIIDTYSLNISFDRVNSPPGYQSSRLPRFFRRISLPYSGVFSWE